MYKKNYILLIFLFNLSLCCYSQCDIKIINKRIIILSNVCKYNKNITFYLENNCRINFNSIEISLLDIYKKECNKHILYVNDRFKEFEIIKEKRKVKNNIKKTEITYKNDKIKIKHQIRGSYHDDLGGYTYGYNIKKGEYKIYVVCTDMDKTYYSDTIPLYVW